MQRLCIKCVFFKNIDDFYKRKNGWKDNICKSCKINRTALAVLKKRILFGLSRTEKDKARRNKRRLIKSAKKLNINTNVLLFYRLQKKELTKKRKKLKKLITLLNRHKPSALNILRFKYKISDQEFLELSKDNPADATLIHRIRYRYDAEFCLRERIKNQLRKKTKKYPNIDINLRNCLTGKQKKCVYENILGYKIKDLKIHLERQFTKNMNWQEFTDGNIHIDHIKPQSLFDLQNIDEIKECWSLENLQPLWAEDNIRKGNRYDRQRLKN